MKRDKAINIVKELPREFELEALIERLVFVEKVEQGLAKLKKGKTLTDEKVKKKPSKKGIVSKTPNVKISKGLDKLADKVLFPEKLEEANRILKTAGLPKKLRSHNR